MHDAIMPDTIAVLPCFTGQAPPQLLSHATGKKTNDVISQFDPSSVHILQLHIVCGVICFLVVAGPSGEVFWLFYQGMLS